MVQETGMEDGSGDEDGGWRTATVTNPVNRAENEDGEQFRRRDGGR